VSNAKKLVSGNLISLFYVGCLTSRKSLYKPLKSTKISKNIFIYTYGGSWVPITRILDSKVVHSCLISENLLYSVKCQEMSMGQPNFIILCCNLHPRPSLVPFITKGISYYLEWQQARYNTMHSNHIELSSPYIELLVSPMQFLGAKLQAF